MDKNDNIVMISKDIRVNEKHVRERLQDCGDIQIRRMRLGEERKVDCLMVYIEVATSNMMLEDSALGKMIGHFWEISPAQIQEFAEYNSLGIADVKKLCPGNENFQRRIPQHGCYGSGNGKGASWFQRGLFRFRENQFRPDSETSSGYPIEGGGILYRGTFPYIGADCLYGRSGAGGISGAGEGTAGSISD